MNQPRKSKKFQYKGYSFTVELSYGPDGNIIVRSEVPQISYNYKYTRSFKSPEEKIETAKESAIRAIESYSEKEERLEQAFE